VEDAVLDQARSKYNITGKVMIMVEYGDDDDDDERSTGRQAGGRY
jgi:hypothetical protein